MISLAGLMASCLGFDHEMGKVMFPGLCVDDLARNKQCAYFEDSIKFMHDGADVNAAALSSSTVEDKAFDF